MNGKTSEEIIEEAVGSVKPYTHPQQKQCNYVYTHPQDKQCSYSVNIVNNLESNDANSALSAAQGKALNERFNDKLEENILLHKVLVHSYSNSNIDVSYSSRIHELINGPKDEDSEIVIGYLVETSGSGYMNDPIMGSYVGNHYLDFDLNQNNDADLPIGDAIYTTINAGDGKIEILFNSKYYVKESLYSTLSIIGSPKSINFYVGGTTDDNYKMHINNIDIKIYKYIIK